jgi:hypothetical protein
MTARRLRRECVQRDAAAIIVRLGITPVPVR